MKALAERVIECRQPGTSLEIDLNCNGIQLTGWLTQVQPDGLLRWRPSMLSVSQGLRTLAPNILSTVLAVNCGESRMFVRKEGEWRFPPMEPEQALHYASLYIEGYRQGMNKPLLLRLKVAGRG